MFLCLHLSFVHANSAAKAQCQWMTALQIKGVFKFTRSADLVHLCRLPHPIPSSFVQC